MSMPRTIACARGHVWTPESTRIMSDGKRNCKICANMKRRERRKQNGRTKHMNTITIKKRMDDYIAYANLDKTVWEAGKTKQEAFWNLMVTVGRSLNIHMEEVSG